MPQIAQLIGGAGTGKTTELLRLMASVIERGVDPFAIGFVSFTRAARSEAATRAAQQFGVPVDKLEQEGWFRTLHSICYKCLGVGKELLTDTRESRQWIEQATQAEVTGAREQQPDGAFESGTQADRALQIWDCARARLTPFRDAWELNSLCDDNCPPLSFCEALIDRYEQSKRLDGRVDFTDILGRYAGVKFYFDGPRDTKPDGWLPEVPVWFFDEQQDASALLDKVCHRLITPAEWVYVVGDPFQCQPWGTPVLTANGYKPIQKLDPATDKLVAFNLRDSRFYGNQKKIDFQIAHRMVDSSELIEITLGNGVKHVSTENHKWVTRLVRGNWFATYLMRKGNRWRVGTVQMFANGPHTKKNGDFRLLMRAAQEQSQQTWILKVFPTDCEARAYEQIVSCRFGLPQVTFRPPCGQTNLNRWFIDHVFDSLGPLDRNGHECLDWHGLSYLHPYLEKGSRHKNGSKSARRIAACNLLPGIAALPRKTAIGIEWDLITAVRRLDRGEKVLVYSLDVAKHHTYVTKDYVTGNSIYGFAGADSKYFMGWPVPEHKRRIMPKSYRCPAPVHLLGESILQGCSDYWNRGIQPADHDGDVARLSYDARLANMVNPTESWLLIARSNFQAGRMATLLNRAGIPWIPTRGPGGWDAPARNAALETLLDLEFGEPIDGAQWKAVLKHLPTKVDDVQLLVRGTKARFDDDKYPAAEKHPYVRVNELDQLGATQELIKRVSDGRWRALIDKGEQYAQAVERWGQSVVRNPRVRVGTIHSVKGAEADNVMLLTTISLPVVRGQGTEQGRNEEHRVFYVGATRARKNLYVVREHRARYAMRLPI